MIRTLILMVFVTSVTPIFGASTGDRKEWIQDFKTKFDASILSGFDKRPLTVEEAEEANYIQVENPDKTSGFADLTHWVKKGEWCYVISLLFDENGKLAGMQINQPVEEMKSYFGLEEQGFRKWEHLGVTYAYIAAYWVSEDKQTRISSNSETDVIRSEHLTVTGFNGALDKIAVDTRNLDSIWKKQACIPWMGTHYYYNMTQSLPCDKPMYPWFVLADEKLQKVIGIALMIFGESQCKMEDPSRKAVEMIVPTGPKCLYDMVTNHHVFTYHTYLVNSPRLITC